MVHIQSGTTLCYQCSGVVEAILIVIYFNARDDNGHWTFTHGMVICCSTEITGIFWTQNDVYLYYNKVTTSKQLHVQYWRATRLQILNTLINFTQLNTLL